MNKLYRFQYFTEDNFPFLHQVRDLPILAELSDILYKAGYRYEDCFLNYPGMTDLESGLISFGKNDLMILTTRPPYSDQYQKRKIYRTGHIYEKQMLEQIGTCFKSLSRQRLFLNSRLSSKLTEGFKNRASIAFYANKNKSNKSAGYKEISAYGYHMENDWKPWIGKNKTHKSCAFIILFKKSGILPKMLHVFGIGGEEGLIFSRILRNGLWNELNIDLEGPPRFIMVEFEIQVPKKYPTNFNFITDFNYDVILDTELP